MKWKVIALLALFALAGCFESTYDIANDFPSATPIKAGIYDNDEYGPTVVAQMNQSTAVAKAIATDKQPGNIYMVSSSLGIFQVRFFTVPEAPKGIYVMQLTDTTKVPTRDGPRFAYQFARLNAAGGLDVLNWDYASLPQFVKDKLSPDTRHRDITNEKRDTALVLRAALGSEGVTFTRAYTLTFVAPLRADN